MTKFVLYASNPELFAQEISHIKSLLFFHNTEFLIISDINHFIRLIPQLCNKNDVVLLFASSDEELEDLIEIREHFGDIQIVLVLPDEETKTLQRGMSLSPQFYMSKHSGLNHFLITTISQPASKYVEEWVLS